MSGSPDATEAYHGREPPHWLFLCCYGTRHQMLSFHARFVLVHQEVLARKGYSDVHECVCGIDCYESDSQSEEEREKETMLLF